MTDFLTAWDAIRTVTVSPGRVVKAELAAGSHPRLSFNPAVLRQYDEQALAAEIEQVLVDVREEFQRRADALLPKRPDGTRIVPTPATLERHRRYAEALAATRIEATSPRGHLSVTITAEGLRVSMRPRALSQLGFDHRVLAAEADAVIAEAHTNLDKQHARVHEAVYAVNRKERTR